MCLLEKYFENNYIEFLQIKIKVLQKLKENIGLLSFNKYLQNTVNYQIHNIYNIFNDIQKDYYYMNEENIYLLNEFLLNDCLNNKKYKKQKEILLDEKFYLHINSIIKYLGKKTEIYLTEIIGKRLKYHHRFH